MTALDRVLSGVGGFAAGAVNTIALKNLMSAVIDSVTVMTFIIARTTQGPWLNRPLHTPFFISVFSKESSL